MPEDAHARRGRLSMEELRTAVESGSIETVIVAFPDPVRAPDGKAVRRRGVRRGGGGAWHARVHVLLTADMEMEPVRGYRFANWELGYGDFHLVPDATTLVVASWLEKTALVICDLHDTRTGDEIRIAPRSILKRQFAAARALDFTAFAASELEDTCSRRRIAGRPRATTATYSRRDVP